MEIVQVKTPRSSLERIFRGPPTTISDKLVLRLHVHTPYSVAYYGHTVALGGLMRPLFSVDLFVDSHG